MKVKKASMISFFFSFRELQSSRLAMQVRGKGLGPLSWHWVNDSYTSNQTRWIGASPQKAQFHHLIRSTGSILDCLAPVTYLISSFVS